MVAVCTAPRNSNGQNGTYHHITAESSDISDFYSSDWVVPQRRVEHCSIPLFHDTKIHQYSGTDTDAGARTEHSIEPQHRRAQHSGGGGGGGRPRGSAVHSPATARPGTASDIEAGAAPRRQPGRPPPGPQDFVYSIQSYIIQPHNPTDTALPANSLPVQKKNNQMIQPFSQVKRLQRPDKNEATIAIECRPSEEFQCDN